MNPESDELGSRTEMVPRTCQSCGGTFQGHRMIVRAVDPITGGIDEISRDFGRLCQDCMGSSTTDAHSEQQLALKRDREKAWLAACPEGYRNEYIMERIAKPTATTEAGRHWDKVRLVREALNAGKGCYLFGPTGAFKTTSMYHGLVKALVWKKVPYIACSVAKWRGEMIAASKSAHWDAGRAIRPYVATPYLFLDDLGHMAMTATSAEALWLLMEERAKANRPIFVTSNFDHDEMIRKFEDNEKLGVSIMKRIARLTGTPIKCAV